MKGSPTRLVALLAALATCTAVVAATTDTLQVEAPRLSTLSEPKRPQLRPPSAQILDRMRRSTDVRIVRLTGEWVGTGRVQFIGYADYKVAWTRPLANRGLASRLIRLLGRAESFDSGVAGQKKCGPMPGLAVRFCDPEGEVDVLLCFECEMLWIAAGNVHMGGDFDRMRGKFVQWARAAVPNDPAFRALEPR